MAWRYTTFTWPTNPSWSTDSTYGYSLVISGVTGVTGDSAPVLDPLVENVSTKSNIEGAWSHILKAETLSTAGQIKFYSDSNSLSSLNGVKIQVCGF